LRGEVTGSSLRSVPFLRPTVSVVVHRSLCSSRTFPSLPIFYPPNRRLASLTPQSSCTVVSDPNLFSAPPSIVHHRQGRLCFWRCQLPLFPHSFRFSAGKSVLARGKHFSFLSVDFVSSHQLFLKAPPPPPMDSTHLSGSARSLSVFPSCLLRPPIVARDPVSSGHPFCLSSSRSSSDFVAFFPGLLFYPSSLFSYTGLLTTSFSPNPFHPSFRATDLALGRVARPSSSISSLRICFCFLFCLVETDFVFLLGVFVFFVFLLVFVVVFFFFSFFFFFISTTLWKRSSPLWFVGHILPVSSLARLSYVSY